MSVIVYSGCFSLLFLLLTIVALIAFRLQEINREKGRTTKLWRIAHELGFDFFPETSETYMAKFAGVALFLNKYRKRIFNVMEGRQGKFEVMLFDYVIGFDYLNIFDTNNTKFYRTVICFCLVGNPLPNFYLQPETVWHKSAKKFGKKDIDIETDSFFSKRYLLQGNDEKAIRALFTDELCAFYKNKSNVSTEVANDYFLYYRCNERIDPEDILTFIEEGLDALMLCLNVVE